MKTKKQKVILALKISVAAVIVLIAAFYVFRDAVLQQTIAKISHEMEVDYNANFSVKSASFDGLSGLQFSDLVLAPKNADTLFKIQKLETSVNLWQLLGGNVQVGTLHIDNGYIQLVKNGKKSNFEAFLKKDKQVSTDNEKRDYAEFAYRLISKTLNLVPTDMELNNVAFKFNDNGNQTNIQIQN